MIGKGNINCKLLLVIIMGVSNCVWYCYFGRKKINEFIKNQSSSQACVQPNLPVYSPEIMKFVREEQSIDCSHTVKDWVVCEVSKKKTIKENFCILIVKMSNNE